MHGGWSWARMRSGTMRPSNRWNGRSFSILPNRMGARERALNDVALIAYGNGIKILRPCLVLTVTSTSHRCNFKCQFAYVEGESLIMALKDMAVSSGSVLYSASLELYVFAGIGFEWWIAHTVQSAFTMWRAYGLKELIMVIGCYPMPSTNCVNVSLMDMVIKRYRLKHVEVAHH